MSGLSTVLLVFGIANLVGTSLPPVGFSMGLRATLRTAPLLLAVWAAAPVASGEIRPTVVGTIAIWGFLFCMVPNGRSTWVTRHLGDEAKSAGGLSMATIQVANTVGVVRFGGMLMAVTAGLVAKGVRSRPRTSAPDRDGTFPASGESGSRL